MRIADIMKQRVETVTAGEPAENAWNLMALMGIRHLVVLDGSHIVGIVSERDIGGADREALRKTKTVRDVMTPYAIKAKRETTLREAANLMRGWSIGCLPVVEDDGTLAGIVTVSDLLELFGTGAQRPVARARRPAPRRRSPRVSRTVV